MRQGLSRPGAVLRRSMIMTIMLTMTITTATTMPIMTMRAMTMPRRATRTMSTSIPKR